MKNYKDYKLEARLDDNGDLYFVCGMSYNIPHYDYSDRVFFKNLNNKFYKFVSRILSTLDSFSIF